MPQVLTKQKTKKRNVQGNMTEPLEWITEDPQNV